METREIKFRAWDNGEMLYSKAMPDFGFWKWSGYSTDTVIMQYTGLKDKNGKEIYEGDIVKYEVWEKFHKDVSNVTRVVDWSEKMCGWNPMCQHTEVDDGYYNWEIENIEIIGNIYQNPELLK